MGKEIPLSDKVLQTLWAFLVLNFAVVTKGNTESVFCLLGFVFLRSSLPLENSSSMVDPSISEVSSVLSSANSSVTVAFLFSNFSFLG